MGGSLTIALYNIPPFATLFGWLCLKLKAKPWRRHVTSCAEAYETPSNARGTRLIRFDSGFKYDYELDDLAANVLLPPYMHVLKPPNTPKETKP